MYSALSAKMVIAVVLLAVVPALVSAQTSDTGEPLVIGCVSQTYTPSDAMEAGAYANGELCGQSCYDNAAGPFHYAVWEYVEDDVNRCQCSNVSPATNDFVQGPESTGTCTLTTQSVFYATSSTYTNEGCQSSTSATGAISVASPEVCLSACRLYTYAFFSITSSSTLVCACGDATNVGPVPAFCSAQDSWLALRHTANAAVAGPTGFVRRQMEEKRRKEEKAKRENRWCPAGLTACKVPGDELAFECLDVADELESCGGCMNGDFGSDKISFGVDCSALPGIAPGGVTCTKGLCQAYACETGYDLASNSTCLMLL
ncbi:hypothetical protein IAR55_004187 [Kwoniella newhampshirensis]|uniref:Protein CPL1-like domain-containing protein n=1 Tax=Kwoniella newhampshirensis TaxID=1651941 RepID=A0AAW0YWH4_9TREE